MKWIELNKLSFQKSPCVELPFYHFLSIGVRKDKTAQHEKERHTTVTPELKVLSNNMK